jgi:hypothetical protein
MRSRAGMQEAINAEHNHNTCTLPPSQCITDHAAAFCAACYVVMRSRAGMQEAINAKHNTELEGRKISVKEAIPQDQIPPEARGRDRYRASSSYRGCVCACANCSSTSIPVPC